MTPPIHRLAIRLVFASLGLALAGGLVAHSLPAAATRALTATARFSLRPIGELAVSPAAPSTALTAPALRPGAAAASAGFIVHNQTGAALRVGFRAQASAGALNGLLRVRLAIGRRTLLDVSLQALLAGVQSTLVLQPAATSAITLSAWIPADAGDGYEGQQVDVALTPEITKAV